MTPSVSIIIPTYNPEKKRLAKTLAGLRAQTLEGKYWECILVNNASTEFPDSIFFERNGPKNIKIVKEERIGLSFARACGLRYAKADIVVFVDDDNILADDYLAHALNLAKQYNTIGILGGKITPEFQVPHPPWISDFHGILACWDHGPSPLISAPKSDKLNAPIKWPFFAPIGAGMVIRRAVWQTWLSALESGDALLKDRQGATLTSGGDNEIVLMALKSGWQVGYFPSLKLTHLIPESRLQTDYLARLNFGCSAGFIQALRRHNACPWPPISRWTLPLRIARAWLRCRAWRGPAERIRWRGLCGHFTARVR